MPYFAKVHRHSALHYSVNAHVPLAQVDALRAQLQSARLGGTPEPPITLSFSGPSTGTAAAAGGTGSVSSRPIPPSEVRANLAAAAHALPPLYLDGAALEAGLAGVTAAALGSDSAHYLQRSGSSPRPVITTGAQVERDLLGRGSDVSSGSSSGAGSTAGGAAAGVRSVAAHAALAGQEEEGLSDGSSSSSGMGTPPRRVGSSSASSVLTEELLQQSIEKMSNMVSDSETGSDAGFLGLGAGFGGMHGVRGGGYGIGGSLGTSAGASTVAAAARLAAGSSVTASTPVTGGAPVTAASSSYPAPSSILSQAHLTSRAAPNGSEQLAVTARITPVRVRALECGSHCMFQC